MAVATLKAISECTGTPDESGHHTLLDGDIVSRLQKQRQQGMRHFITSVFESMPMKISTKMIPAREGLSTPKNWASQGANDYQERYNSVAIILKEALGEDLSEFRNQTIQHVVLHQLGLNDDGLLNSAASKLSWPIAESLKIYEEAKEKVDSLSESK